MKAFKLRADQIHQVTPQMGSCIASDMITVDGLPVCWMYREEPDDDIDSGWRFFSGEEDDAYANNAANLSRYDVNTIANYDRDIIPFLAAPFGSAFERAHGAQPFQPARIRPSNDE
jgi:hypothetical protein